MHKESILKFSLEKGFGETHWITCPVCWNAMKVTEWENGSIEEECAACERIQRTSGSPRGTA
jgi:hypothetical protein